MTMGGPWETIQVAGAATGAPGQRPLPVGGLRISAGEIGPQNRPFAQIYSRPDCSSLVDVKGSNDNAF